MSLCLLFFVPGPYEHLMVRNRVTEELHVYCVSSGLRSCPSLVCGFLCGLVGGSVFCFGRWHMWCMGLGLGHGREPLDAYFGSCHEQMVAKYLSPYLAQEGLKGDKNSRSFRGGGRGVVWLLTGKNSASSLEGCFQCPGHFALWFCGHFLKG